MFRTTCSVAGPKLGYYSQWVHLRAPTKKARRSRKEMKTYADGYPRLQEGFVAALEGFGFSPELGLDAKGRLVQGARPAPVYPTYGRGVGHLGVGDRRARGADLLWPRC